ncbi:hypothetical protein ACWKW6_02755 [Dyadobacter jiangsuensis]
MKVISVRTFAGCVRTFAARVPLSVSYMQQWGWIIAAFVRRRAGYVLPPAKWDQAEFMGGN